MARIEETAVTKAGYEKRPIIKVTYICAECDDKYISWGNIHDTFGVPSECYACGYKGSMREYKKEAVDPYLDGAKMAADNHPDTIVFQCDICSFEYRSELNVFGDCNPPKRCPECGEAGSMIQAVRETSYSKNLKKKILAADYSALEAKASYAKEMSIEELSEMTKEKSKMTVAEMKLAACNKNADIAKEVSAGVNAALKKRKDSMPIDWAKSEAVLDAVLDKASPTGRTDNDGWKHYSSNYGDAGNQEKEVSEEGPNDEVILRHLCNYCGHRYYSTRIRKHIDHARAENKYSKCSSCRKSQTTDTTIITKEDAGYRLNMHQKSITKHKAKKKRSMVDRFKHSLSWKYGESSRAERVALSEEAHIHYDPNGYPMPISKGKALVEKKKKTKKVKRHSSVEHTKAVKKIKLRMGIM